MAENNERSHRELNEAISARVAGTIWRSAMVALPITMINALALGGLLFVTAPSWQIAAWSLGIALFCGLRFFYCREKFLGKAAASGRDVVRLIIAAGASGGLWGASVFFIGPNTPVPLSFAIVFMIAGQTAGAAVAFAGAPRVAIAYNGAALTVLGIYFVTKISAAEAGLYYAALIPILVLYFGTMHQLVVRSHDAIRSAFENEHKEKRKSEQIANQTIAFKALADHYKSTSERAESAERALMKKTQELSLIFDNTRARIWFKDDQNRIIRLNRAAANSMGMTVRDAEGACSYALFPEQAAKYHKDDLVVFESGKPLLGIVEEYTPARGERGWLRTDKIPYTDPETGNRYLFVCAIDITELRETQEKLYRLNETLARYVGAPAELEDDTFYKAVNVACGG